MSLNVQTRIANWARRRQGKDSNELTLHSRRIYILPNAQGIAFGLLLIAMLIGAMNYNNSLGLAITFLLASMLLVTMHHCHRNLSELTIRYGGDEPAFAGQDVFFLVTLINDSKSSRFGLTLARNGIDTVSVQLRPGQHQTIRLPVATVKRGKLELDRFRVYTSFPLGVFNCWAWVHPDWNSLVYPRPAPPGLEPAAQHNSGDGSFSNRDGDSDFAGLRNFRDGDSPRHVAWKAYAREQGLQVKQYSSSDLNTEWFDFDALDQMDTEARLSQLTRWVIEAFNSGNAWGLRIPGRVIEPDIGRSHRDRCLTALALL